MSTPIFDSLMADSDATTRALVHQAVTHPEPGYRRRYAGILRPGFVNELLERTA